MGVATHRKILHLLLPDLWIVTCMCVCLGANVCILVRRCYKLYSRSNVSGSGCGRRHGRVCAHSAYLVVQTPLQEQAQQLRTRMQDLDQAAEMEKKHAKFRGRNKKTDHLSE